MQRLETDKLILYYPEPYRDEALRVAERLTYCRALLEDHTVWKVGPPAEKSMFVLPRVELNNAYVSPPFGSQQIAVLPLYATAHGFFMNIGMPPDSGIVGCHEMVHDVHARQVSGAAKAVRTVLGNYYTPQSGFDPWFWEGLAVYYETKLQGVGRLNNPLFEGVFAAGISGTTITGDDLNYVNRAYKYGAMYLVGSRFIDYLARTYGEDKLWSVIAEKSNEIGFVLANNNVFKRVYGKNLSALIDDFAADTRQRYPVQERPPEQTVMRYHEQSTELVWGASGHSVVIKQGLDQQARITVYDPSGRELASHFLNDIGVGRRLIATSVDFLNGLSLTADGQHAYFVALDVAPASSSGLSNFQSRLVHVDVARDRIEIIDNDLHGSGGSVSPDGTRYFYARGTDDSLGVWVYDFATHEHRPLGEPPKRTYRAQPMVSPDGTTLLVTEGSDAYFALALYDATTGERRATVATPTGFVLQPSWVDATHVVYMADANGRAQVFETDLTTGTHRQLTHAPYAVTRPFVHDGRLKFLNREHWLWTEDEVPYAFADRLVDESAIADNELEAPAVADSEDAPPPVASEDDAPVSEAFAFDAQANALTPIPTAVEIVSERPYSGVEHLLVPQAWAPYLFFRGDHDYKAGAYVTGGDVLGYHRWGVFGAWDTQADAPTLSVTYINGLAAPFMLRLDAAYLGRQDDSTDDLVGYHDVPVNITEKAARLVLERDWFSSWTTDIGARYVGARYEVDATNTEVTNHHFAGPTATVALRSFDSTPYGGTRRGFAIGTTATYFPASASSVAYDLTDAEADLALVAPLPFSKRHRLTVTGTGRALFGAPTSSRLLEVGGGGNAGLPVRTSLVDVEEVKGAGLLPPGLRFFTPLRGFEDEALFGRYVVTGQAEYRYPVIFDAGTATTLRFLPSVALRQIDLELFYATASLVDAGRQLAQAAGGATQIRTLLWQAPVTLTLQLARRLSHDESVAFYFAVGPG